MNIAICEKLRKITIMTNPIQLLRDYQERKETRYEGTLEEVIKDISEHFDSNQFYDEQTALYYGILYGIKHRKEILKQVKI